jgi:hypothetical protein
MGLSVVVARSARSLTARIGAIRAAAVEVHLVEQQLGAV